MKQYRLALIFFDYYPQSTINQIYKSLNYFKNLSPDGEKLIILDLTNFSLKKINNNYIHEDKNIIYIKPRNYSELKKFFKKNKKIYALGPVHSDFKSILVFFLLKWFNAKIIFINSYGYYLTSKKTSNLSILFKINNFFLFKLSYFLSRILSIFFIFPKIEYYFETSQVRIDQIESSFCKKVNKKINFLDLSLAKNIFRINSVYYDEIIKLKMNNIKEDYIVVADSGFDHPDRYLKEKNINSENLEIDKKKYYSDLYSVLIKIKASYNLEIIFCEHPKIDYENNPYYKKFKEDFIIKKNQTNEYIKHAKIVVFTGGSSMVNQAIIYQKKIIYLTSKLIGEYNNNLIYSFLNVIDLKAVELNESYEIDKDKLEFELVEKKKNYNKYINENLIVEKNISSKEQIKKVLYSKI